MIVDVVEEFEDYILNFPPLDLRQPLRKTAIQLTLLRAAYH